MMIIPKIISMFGLACYLTVAVMNNIQDHGTNEHLLSQMFHMDLLKGEKLGQGLLSRVVQSANFPKIVLKVVITIQLLIALMLWVSATQLLIVSWLNPQNLTYALNCCVIAITCFMSLWFFFWCGGLYFGYWIKTGQIQEVHMKLIIISLAELILLASP